MSSEYKDIRDNAKDSKSSQLIHDIGLVNNQNKKMPCSAYMWNMAFFCLQMQTAYPLWIRREGVW